MTGIQNRKTVTQNSIKAEEVSQIFSFPLYFGAHILLMVKG